jgi:hypothetical protein
MNWPLVLAGVLALTGAGVHGIVGDRILRRIARDTLPGNPFGPPRTTFTLIRVTWHLVTAVFLWSGLALLYVAWSGDAQFRPGVTMFLGVLYSGFALFGVTTALMQRKLLRHPAPLGFCVTAALIWWGAT